MILASATEFLFRHKLSLMLGGSCLLYGFYFLKRHKGLPPGPLGYPYIGSSREISQHISRDFSRLATKYGDIFCLWMGGSRYVTVLHSYKLIKEATITRGSDFADRKPGYTLGNWDIIDQLAQVLNYISIWMSTFDDTFDALFGGKPTRNTSDNIDFQRFIHTHIKTRLEKLSSGIEPNTTCDIFITEGALQKFGMEHFANMLMELLPNGIHTASRALELVVYRLAKHPEYEEAMVKQIKDLKGSFNVSLSDRPSLPLVESFLLESLRISPPLVTSMASKPRRTTTLSGYNIPEYMSLIYHIKAVHMDESLFSDPQMFKPERFIVNNKVKIPNGFLAFGIGRRSCAGEYLMRNALFYIFATLLQKYKTLDYHMDSVLAEDCLPIYLDMRVLLEPRDLDMDHFAVI